MEKEEILERIFENIKNGKNSLIWKKNTYEYADLIKERYRAVYINETDPIKSKMIKVIREVSKLQEIKNIESEEQLSKKTKDQLKELLKKRNKKNKLVIIFNHFERLTRTSAQYWMSLVGNPFIVMVGSTFGIHKKEAYGFYKTFKLINKEEQEESRAEMNITIPFILIIGVLIFLCLYKLSLISSDKVMTAVIMSILVTRTILYFVK
ncbi:MULTISPECIES: hypothetical protein [Methanobacterium]|uniref:Uncharacterized protein n=1 Tax=Methanobacterium veterum TaxID=408577 RepID=A0A9E4ZSH6_9EURY|nr:MULTISPECIES: hypothetical protein [Methanobacterium]MCZ3364882.1 hypothetical protein [Methanobacterium veterum]MCZ3372637.1 hypothetical protein [Methanobacterium veterum]